MSASRCEPASCKDRQVCPNRDLTRRRRRTSTWFLAKFTAAVVDEVHAGYRPFPGDGRHRDRCQGKQGPAGVSAGTPFEDFFGVRLAVG
mmetsp:Transcript_31503/g.69020  ORF Transcript_31503/g.69020 Transcript_31503/m.69020 type:complete len:89 (-) Transcript_31503:358-624(-)